MARKKAAGRCTICGKKLYYGDPAYATTAGSMEEYAEGFIQSDSDPWLTVACKSCGERISRAITNLCRED